MKKIIPFLMVMGISLTFIGCQQAENANDQLEVLDPNNRETTTDEGSHAELGYVRYTKEELDVDMENREILIDREQTADIITRTIMQTANFDEAATLVTDREIVIAFDKNPDMEKTEANDIAKKTARSFLPEFYEIYTSDNPYHMDIIHSLHREATDNPEDLQVIDKLIEEIEGENDEPHRR